MRLLHVAREFHRRAELILVSTASDTWQHFGRSEPLCGDSVSRRILTFLEALTDPAAAALGRDVPDSVPSGLPVRD
jgi:hypothetical protein